MIHLQSSNINKANWSKLKEYVTKNGAKAWEFEGDYEILKITFKDNATALRVSHDLNRGSLEVSAFGDVTTERGVITVELNDDAQNAMALNTTSSLSYSTPKETLTFNKEFDEDEVKKLVNAFDPYASRIDDGAKHSRVNKMNDHILDSLKEMGCTNYTIKDVHGNSGKADWAIIK